MTGSWLGRPDVMEPRRGIARAQIGEVRLSDLRLQRQYPALHGVMAGDRRDQAPGASPWDREIGQQESATGTKHPPHFADCLEPELVRDVMHHETGHHNVEGGVKEG